MKIVFLAAMLACACSGGGSAGGQTDNASGKEVDAGARVNRFYVANTGGTTISVIDQASQSVVSTIELGNQPHGHAPSSAGDFIYATTDGGHGEVIAIDTATNNIAWRVDAGTELNEPHITRDDRYVYAPDLLAGRVAVVDVQTHALAGEIEIVDSAGQNLTGLHNTYASHDGQRMYVTAIFSQAIAEIDVATRAITRIYTLSGQPRPLALTDDDQKMYIQLSELHGFIELDLASGNETARIEWPEPASTPPGMTEAETIPTKCHGIGITPDGTELWAATSMESAVYVYSLPALEQKARFQVGQYPNWMAFSSDGTTAYITNTEPLAAHGTVSVVDVPTHTVKKTIDVGPAPKRIHRIELPR